MSASSARSVLGVRVVAAAAFLAALGLAGCATPGVPLEGRPFESLPRLSAPLPDEADRLARDAAVALWRGDAPALARSAEALEGIEAARKLEGLPPTGLAAYARDAETALLPAGPERRAAQARVLKRHDAPVELATRLEDDVADDPLKLARKRLREDRLIRWGGAANQISEGLGGSMVSPVLVPVRITQSLVRVALSLHDEEDLTPRQRQALKHWRDFVESNPNAPEAAALIGKIEGAQQRWLDLQVERAVKQGEAALRQDEPILAGFLAERAMRYRSEDPRARSLSERSTQRGRAWNENRARTLTVANPVAPLDDASLRLARALLDPQADLAAAADAVQGAPQASAHAREVAELARALVAREAGREQESWDRIEALAEHPTAVGRHADAMLRDFDANPYRAFRLARREKNKESARRLALGPLAFGPREHGLPRPLEWLIEVPTLTSVVLGLPSRLMAFPYGRSEKRAAVELGHRYLERWPNGVHAGEVRQWLFDYEKARGNAVGALGLADGLPDFDAKDRAKLREDAAEQMAKAAERERSRAGRAQLLARTAEQFPETEAAGKARDKVRSEVKRATAQRIQVSREYLIENPEVAGPRGFALQASLLDGDMRNGELHDDGVALIGGRWIEIAYVGDKGKNASPETRRVQVSDDHLARIAAVLEESAQRRTRIDRDADFLPDAGREAFFERARLGLADRALRMGSERTEFEFRGMREMYGIVRSRESILPVELVVQTGLQDLGFGMFPRIRMPQATADQFLYR